MYYFRIFTFRLPSITLEVCPRTWIYLQGSCYKISSHTMNWNTAKSACQGLGGTLAMVKSQAEQRALASKISHITWIGLHGDPKDSSRWLWVDGTRPSYTRWYSGEPNNSGGNEGYGEMYVKSDGWSWNDAPCSSSNRYYVCDKNGESEYIIHVIIINNRVFYISKINKIELTVVR